MLTNISNCIKKKISVAIVGAGHIGKRHAILLQEHPDAQLIALADIKPYEELDLPAQLRSLPLYQDIYSLLESEKDIDLVHICTPNGSHASLAAIALAEKKHVVIEKPICLHVVDGIRLKELSLKYQKRIFSVLQNRYTPCIQWLKECVSLGKFGHIYHIDLQCYWNRDERYYHKNTWHGSLNLDGGTLFTQYSHFIDLLYWIFGEMEAEEAHFENISHHGQIAFEDTGYIRMLFARGMRGSLTYSTAVYGSNMGITLTILAQRASIRIGGSFLNKLEHCIIKDSPDLPSFETSIPCNHYGGYTGSAQNHQYVIHDILQSLKGDQQIFVPGVDEGMKVVEIIQSFYKKGNWEELCRRQV